MKFGKEYANSIISRCNVIAVSYSQFLHNRPLTVMVIISFISVTLTSVTFSLTEFPRSAQPKVGFETRGTEISAKILAFKNLDAETSFYPDSSKRYYRQYLTFNDRKKRNADEQLEEHPPSANIDPDIYSQLIFELPSIDHLFRSKVFRELCNFEKSIYKEIRANFIEMLDVRAIKNLPVPIYNVNLNSNHSDSTSGCDVLSQSSIESLRHILEYCSRFKNAYICKETAYSLENGNNALATSLCSSIPQNCTNHLLADSFEYTLSKSAFKKPGKEVYIATFLPVMQFEHLKQLSRNNLTEENFVHLHEFIVEQASLHLHYSQFVGFTLGAKDEMFNKYFASDTHFLFISITLISLIILVFSGSIFYMLAVLITLIYSVGLAYFVYRLVFRITFVPFMNLLVVVLLVGIGADDTFILYHVYYLYKKNSESDTVRIKDVTDAFSNAAVNMFVSSATTAAAFYANLVSDIIVIKCFSVFAGTVMLMNYLLVVSWLPAALIAIDQYVMPVYYKTFPKKYILFCYKWNYLWSFLVNTFLLQKLIPSTVSRLKYLWLFLFSAAFFASLVFVFYKPGFKLPDSTVLKVFNDGNPLEWYDSEMGKRFAFPAKRNEKRLQFLLVWGFKPTMNAKILDPFNIGTLTEDEEFRNSINALESLQQVCEHVYSYNNQSGVSENKCFPSLFFDWSLNQLCSNESTAICCNVKAESFIKENLGYCLGQSSKNYEIVEYGGPLFKIDTFEVKGYMMHVDLTGAISTRHEEFQNMLKYFVADTNDYIKHSSDRSVQNGWLITSDYNVMMFQDLQNSLLRGTPISTVMSVSIAIIIIVLMTKNLLLSAFSTLCIMAVTTSTVACLIFMHWSLNIVEATICILTVGLAFDFTCHFLVGYQLAPLGSRSEKLSATLTYIGLPVILSALTTFLGGCSMLGSATRALYQTGLFMILISATSFAYSTLYFLSLLSAFGPEDDSCLDYNFVCFSKQKRTCAFSCATSATAQTSI